MPHYRDEAVVIRTHKLGEVDRIVTLLTKNHGQVRAVAKGVRKTSSRIGARLEPFMVVDVQLYEGRNLDTVSQVEQLANYGAVIVDDYARYTAASAVVEAAERLTREDSSSKHYLLVLGALRALSAKEQASDQILDSYLLRALAISGWIANLTSCQGCGSDQTVLFSVHSGSVSCANCALPGSVRLGVEGIAHVGSLLAGDWQGVSQATAATRATVSGVVAGYLQWQLERGLRSLEHVERA
ncbi:MAG: DNA repair protein RecO [Aquiluna sp.]|jgi:DNA repair protein RecO (recombination protein O)|nr:DNA repair protein RecO [Micrococcales bacterium]MDG1817443.1 DNA repair protein RecO [Aquiluna sp.]